MLVLHHPVLLESDADLDQVGSAVERVAAHAEDIGRELGFAC